MTAYLRSLEEPVNRKRVINLMQKMGLEAMYPKPHLSKAAKEHLKFPYLLAGVMINHVNHVWGADITYIPTVNGYLYLVAVLDLYSRYVVSWELSESLESDFCLKVLKQAISKGKPEIFNTDQGCQFTSKKFVETLQASKIKISMDGKGRCWDNIFVERLWRTVKYEEVYLKDYESGQEAQSSLSAYLKFYNKERLHQALGYRTPETVFKAA